jgi:hypothetical protein
MRLELACSLPARLGTHRERELPRASSAAAFDLLLQGLEAGLVDAVDRLDCGFVNNDPPPELSDEAAVKAIDGIYKSGLEALKKKVEGGG